MNLSKPVRKRDEKYLAWIRLQPSVVSGMRHEFARMEAHHVPKKGFGKMGSKADDSRAVPLTTLEHRYYHDVGKEEFERTFGVDLEREILRLNREYAIRMARLNVETPRSQVVRKTRVRSVAKHRCPTCGAVRVRRVRD